MKYAKATIGELVSRNEYLSGKIAYIEGKVDADCPYETGEPRGLWLAGFVEMREEFRVLREAMRVRS